MARVPGRGENASAFSVSKFSKKLTRSLLKRAFEEAHRSGYILSPDAAMNRMHELVELLAGPTTDRPESSNPRTDLARFNFLNIKREAHHHAVDLYYAALRPRKGAPPLRDDYLAELLALRSEGLSPRQIAIRLGLGSSAESADRVRKQIGIAKRQAGKK